jgi:hypothetical protein
MSPYDRRVATSHWAQWHEAYEDPSSPLSARLHEVRRQLRDVLDHSTIDSPRLISMCAGQGRDVIDVLATHPRGQNVRATLVELDVSLAAEAAASARDLGLENVVIVNGDASITSTYVDLVPADIIMVCGVFGNLSDIDVARTIFLLPSLCNLSARVIWTRHRRAPDLTNVIRAMFLESGFAEVEFFAPPDFLFTVGTQQLQRVPDPFEEGIRLFTFEGDGHLPA